MSSVKTLEFNDCACCGKEWINRKDTSYENLGSKSTPIIHSMSLISDKKGNHTKLLFCDLHGNNLRSCIRVTNQGVLKIINKATGKWRSATSIGVVV